MVPVTKASVGEGHSRCGAQPLAEVARSQLDSWNMPFDMSLETASGMTKAHDRVFKAEKAKPSKNGVYCGRDVAMAHHYPVPSASAWVVRIHGGLTPEKGECFQAAHGTAGVAASRQTGHVKDVTAGLSAELPKLGQGFLRKLGLPEQGSCHHWSARCSALASREALMIPRTQEAFAAVSSSSRRASDLTDSL